jgi:hypothetical protein
MDSFAAKETFATKSAATTNGDSFIGISLSEGERVT